MANPRRVSSVWIGALLTAGALLAVALLVQTILNYQYVSNNLIRQQIRRTADERLRNVERAARLSRPQDPEAFQGLLDDLPAGGVVDVTQHVEVREPQGPGEAGARPIRQVGVV